MAITLKKLEDTDKIATYAKSKKLAQKLKDKRKPLTEARTKTQLNGLFNK